MQELSSTLGQLAAFFAMAQVIPYIITIIWGKTRPSRVSYGIWSIVQIITVSSYISAGATTTKWTLLVLAINSIVVFLLSLWRGMGGFSKFDIACLIVATIAILLWITTNSPTLVVYASTLSWVIGYLPTIKKAYLLPNSESALSWSLYVAATLLNVAALTTLSLAILLPPVLAFCLSATIAVLLLFPKITFLDIKRNAGMKQR